MSKTYRNKNFQKRNYEVTNIVACVATDAPNENWIECDESELNGLSKLWTQGDVQFYGYL
jgi:hypothetical protein